MVCNISAFYASAMHLYYILWLNCPFEIDKTLTFMLKKYRAVFYSVHVLYTKAIYCTMYTI